jgi:type VI protein secretion system component VasF
MLDVDSRNSRGIEEGTVPLSEHEQRLLDQIEQALYAEDPKFASAVRSARSRSRTRRSIIVAILGALAGLALVLVGLIVSVVVVSVVGFVLVVASCGYAAQSLRHRSHQAADDPTAASRTPRSSGLRTRMEDRLRRRFDEN